MHKTEKYKVAPSVIGIICCFLLIVSRLLDELLIYTTSLQAVNTILVIIVLCLCIHLIRSTSEMYHKHVWHSASLITLICMPILNLIVTAVQLVLGQDNFMTKKVFSVIVILFSLPAFFCYFFIYVARKFSSDIRVRVSTAVLSAAGFIYTILRLCDKVFFAYAVQVGVNINKALLNIAAFSSKLSMVIYILAFVCFAVFGRVLYEEQKNEEAENS